MIKTIIRYSIIAVTLIISLSPNFSFAESGPIHSKDRKTEEKAAYMGVGSCSSSNCHGSVSPRNASAVLQNEYVTWEKHDRHSKAWLKLTNEDSKKIAQNLGISSAEKDPLCLSCHATALAEDARTSNNYHIEDGVSCESCHGPAENYLGPHTAKDSTHKKNLENGMADIVSPQKRVALCASCHFGDESKTVNHRLIGAGHPRLTFELDTFSMIQPKRWVVDDDYKERKADYNSTVSWLVGQVYLAKQTIDRLASPTLSKNGIFPELTIFSCYACHHSLTEEQWKVRDYSGSPGELKINDASLLVVRLALNVTNKKLGEQLANELKSLHQNYRKGSFKNFDPIRKILSQAAGDFAKMSQSSSAQDNAILWVLLRELALYGATAGPLQYESAEQIAMGLSSIIATISSNGSLYKAEMDKIYAALSTPHAFQAEQFSQASKLFLDKIADKNS